MARKSSIIFQVLDRIDSLKRFGESKHEAKQLEKARALAKGERWNPAKVEGIYSHKTCESYKEHALNFASWVRETHNVKDIAKIEHSHVKDWLERSVNSDNSAWTVRLQAAAVAKVLGCSSTDFGVKFPTRKRENITRSRGDRKHDKNFSLKNNADLINFAKGTGLRRHEIASVRPEQVILSDKGQVIIQDVKGKGGRIRSVPVVEHQRSHVLHVRDQAISQGKELIFEKVPNSGDIHNYRREYCQARYDEVAADREPSGETYTRKDDRVVFDREVLREVSRDMGHTRVDVIVRHYLN